MTIDNAYQLRFVMVGVTAHSTRARSLRGQPLGFRSCAELTLLLALPKCWTSWLFVVWCWYPEIRAAVIRGECRVEIQARVQEKLWIQSLTILLRLVQRISRQCYASWYLVVEYIIDEVLYMGQITQLWVGGKGDTKVWCIHEWETQD